MRAGRPRSQGPITLPFEGESQKPSPKAKADAVGRQPGVRVSRECGVRT